MQEKSEQLFRYLKQFRAKYDRARAKFERKKTILREIGSKNADKCIYELSEKFDTEVNALKANARSYVTSRARIHDPENQKRLRYHVNLWIAKPDKCPECKTAKDFYLWAGVSPDEIDRARGSPQNLQKEPEKRGDENADSKTAASD